MRSSMMAAAVVRMPASSLASPPVGSGGGLHGGGVAFLVEGGGGLEDARPLLGEPRKVGGRGAREPVPPCAEGALTLGGGGDEPGAGVVDVRDPADVVVARE